MAEVILERLTKVYPNGVTAVRDFSLRVADGELVVLLGPSGCGKTTLLRLVAGLELPTEGSISLDRRPMAGVPPRERDVSMVFQRPALYPHWSVRRNLQFGSRLRGEALGSELNEVARLLGIEPLLDRPPHQLSGGEQQRVALARAVLRRPKVFLLDEPLSDLDAALRTEMRRELHLLCRRLRATMIHVTHDQAEAMSLADRLVVLRAGVLQQEGRPVAVYREPCNRFVAGFVGSPPMNFLDGDLLSRPDGLRFEGQGLSLPMSGEWAAYQGRSITLGIRPEDVGLDGAGSTAVGMEAVLIEPLGGAALVTFQRGPARVTARLPGDPDLRAGDRAEVVLNMQHAHWFDRASERRLGAAPRTG